MKTRANFIIALVLALLLVMSGCSVKDAEAANPEAVDEILECNWILKVDQTIPIKEGDVTVNYSLFLVAQKTGGTDVYGTYEGAAYIGSQLDASELAREFIKIGGGFDLNAFANNLSFEIEPFDKQRYSAYGSKDNASLPPLVDYESMALISPEMKGGVIINTKVKAADGLQGGYSESGSGASPVAMKIAIKSGKVHVDIPAFRIDRSFEGLITGEPRKNSEEYEQGIRKIEELIAKAEAQSDSPDVDAGENSDSIIGNIGSNLEIPAAFPADEFPILPDSVVINTYESKDKRNVRVMLGANTSIEEILAFYKEYVTERPEVQRLDLPDGVMYTGHSGKYAKFQLMVIEDKSTIYKNMVSLEILKK
jgi:hypothetical protein